MRIAVTEAAPLELLLDGQPVAMDRLDVSHRRADAEIQACAGSAGVRALSPALVGGWDVGVARAK
jgi:hypothetical protein